MTECWLMAPHITDQTAPNRRCPNVPFDTAALAELGVFYRRFSNTELQDRAALIDRLKQQLHYEGHDTVCIAPKPEAGGEAAFAATMAKFFEEHIHEDDEARLVWGGSGYFDVRNAEDEWVRIYVVSGDCIILPAGIYHRFTVDANANTEALRLFKENPKWVAIPRPCEDNPVRRRYLQFLHRRRCTILGDVGPTISCSINSNSSNLLVSDPHSLDMCLDTLLQHRAGKVACVVLYFTGAVLPATGGKSWCADCVAAEEDVRVAVHLLQEKRKETLFLQCDVEPSFFGTTHPYCTHPVVKLKSLPTVMILEVTPVVNVLSSSVAENEATNHKANGCWKDRVNIVVRSEHPSVAALTQW
ncbi:putative 1,2-Dihydroxy-3-keto-5-methylthiopentene dioxygenase [Trypanosoma grayi]|uniref:putative 1,2-Dihydroxy-3-keto-5-methylthiopentene dioxygenase n=1 Tax=Trypanosoma grayi TaxID=71804 RepID=UPI0004F44896|nr:putative 1,2-Dihydroxy-3-keto-5-methylthiopentene dioxygenase [Trypanosoma grayi]KEG11111.1 putative 1,2-Dihydroxy-3-keto-5-methylthiopentene dioxygenase [Trypanosoma grayi]